MLHRAMRLIRITLSSAFIACIFAGQAVAQSQYQIDQRNAEYETEKAKKAAARAQEDARRANVRVAEIEAYLIEKERQEQAARQQAAALDEAQRRQQELAQQQAAYQARQQQERAARAEAYRAAVRLYALPSTKLNPSSIMMRQLADGQTLVMIGQEKHTFPTAEQAQAFIAQKKAFFAYWNSLTDAERKAEWDKQTEKDFPWTKDPNDPRFVKMTQIHALFTSRNDEYLNAPNYSHLLAGEAQRQYDLDSARKP